MRNKGYLVGISKSGQIFLILASIGILLLTGFSIASSSDSAVVSSLREVGYKKPGQTAVLQAKVRNTGSTNLVSGCRVRFWVSGRGFVGGTSCNGLQKGKSEVYRYNWRIPSGVNPGRYNYWVIVDKSGKHISKWSSPKSFKVIMPSAKVHELRKVKDKKPGETAVLWARVENNGKIELGPGCRVRFWVSKVGFVGETSCDGLESGRKRWYRYDWHIPSDIKPGVYNYWAIVDELGGHISPWSRPYTSFKIVMDTLWIWDVKDIEMDSNITDYARLESGGEYGRFDTDAIHPIILENGDLSLLEFMKQFDISCRVEIKYKYYLDERKAPDGEYSYKPSLPEYLPPKNLDYE